MNATDPDSPNATDENASRRRDEALKRALNTPPKPKTSGKESGSPAKTGKREKPSD